MKNLLTRKVTPFSLGIILVIVTMYVYLYEYFSPRGQCEREVRKGEVVAAVERVSQAQSNPMTQRILDQLIEGEIKKCLEERADQR